MPKLIFIIGHAGCGKTTIAKKIAKSINCTYLDRDTIGNLFVNKMLEIKGFSPDDRDSEIYHKEFRDIEYNAMLDVAIENLRVGNDVMMISPFTKEINDQSWITNFLETNHLTDVAVKIISVFLSDSEIQRQRILSRNTSRDKWKLDNWGSYKEKLIKIQVNWDNADTLYFDNSVPLSNKQINKLVSFIKTIS